MFLLVQAKPDYDFLSKCYGIRDLRALKEAIAKRLTTIDMKVKQRDFEHLLFNIRNSEKILRFGDFVKALKQ